MKQSELKQLIREEIQKITNEGIFDLFKKKSLPNYKIIAEFPLKDMEENLFQLDPDFENHPEDGYNPFNYLTKNYKSYNGLLWYWRKDLPDDEPMVAIKFTERSKDFNPMETYIIAKRYL